VKPLYNAARIVYSMTGIALTVYVSDLLSEQLDKERERRGIESKPRTVRAILDEYFGNVG